MCRNEWHDGIDGLKGLLPDVGTDKNSPDVSHPPPTWLSRLHASGMLQRCRRNLITELVGERLSTIKARLRMALQIDSSSRTGVQLEYFTNMLISVQTNFKTDCSMLKATDNTYNVIIRERCFTCCAAIEKTDLCVSIVLQLFLQVHSCQQKFIVAIVSKENNFIKKRT